MVRSSYHADKQAAGTLEAFKTPVATGI
jgi:hypothetical protein